jgi:flagellar hook-associated protein 1 FlgK
MTTISAALLSGLSGLRAAQAGLAVASQNIANAATPGYVRAELSLAPVSTIGTGGGVNVTGVHRAADRFLAVASQIAEGARGAASVRADLMERAQASFGDPSGGPSMFGGLDEFWSSLSLINVDPSSSVRASDAVSALQTVLSETRRVAGVVQDLIIEADARISERVSEAQDLLNQIAALNNEISLNRRSGANVTGAENAQSALIDQLSTLMDLRVTPAPDGGVHIRTTAGALLVGVEAAQLSYSPSGSPFGAHGFIAINPQLGTQANLESFLSSGEIKGLLDARDKDLVELAEALGGFAGAFADTLNQVHNENVAYPAAGRLVGRQTGLLGADALNFTGRAVAGVVDAAGALQQRLTIDFDAQTITGEAPAAVYSFAGGTVSALATALNAALGAATPSGSASFIDGVLTLDIGSGGGVTIQQDAANPSDRAGRGFSHFFGLNDLVTRPVPLFFETGVSGTDTHGLAGGGLVSYEIRDASGRFIAQRSVSIAGALAGAGSTWNDFVAALNTIGTGIGEYATFALNAATGRVEMTTNPGFQILLSGDTTQRGSTGVSFSAFNGLSGASTAGRAVELDVNARILANTSLLSVGRADLTVALGQRAVEAGDARGSAALAAARNATLSFPGAGALGPQTVSLANLAARLGGEAGRLAAETQRMAAGAVSVATAAADRRSELESVSLDDELLRMTTYQNAYAASARVIQAATEMLDVLMAIGIRR